MMDCHQHYCWCIWTQPKICQWALTHTYTQLLTHTSFFLSSSFFYAPPSLFHQVSLLLLHLPFLLSSSVSFCCHALVSCRSGWRVFLRGTWAAGVWESAALPDWCSVRTLLPSTGQCLWVTLLAFTLDSSACILPAFGALTAGYLIYKCFIVTSQLPFCMSNLPVMLFKHWGLFCLYLFVLSAC